MIGKINTVTKGLRRFRASSVGEFVIALALSIALGTLMVALVISAMPVAAFGQDATWLGQINSNWNSGTNWIGGVAPVSPSQSAIFDTSTNTLSTLSADASIQSITFTTNARPFTIQTGTNTLSLQGAGIVNNSTNVQTIVNSPSTTNEHQRQRRQRQWRQRQRRQRQHQRQHRLIVSCQHPFPK